MDDQSVGLRRRAVRQGGIFFVVRVSQQIAQLAITFLLARLLTPDDYGVMTAAAILIELADLLAEAGIGKALIHKDEMTADDLAQSLTLSVGLAVGLYAILFVAADALETLFDIPSFATFVRFLGLLVFLTPFRAISGAILERDLRFARNSVIFLVGNLMQALLTLTLAWRGYGAWSLAIGAVVGRLIETALAWHWAHFPLRVARLGSQARGLLRFGVQVSGTSLLWFLYSNAGFAVVGLFLGTVELGTFFLAFQIASMPAQKISSNLNQVLFAVFARLRGDPEQVARAYLRLLRLLQVGVMPALIGLMVVAPDFVPWLLKDKWKPIIIPLQMLCPVGILTVFSATFTPTLIALGRPDVNLRYTALCVVILPAGFILAGLEWGVVGVAGVWLIVFPILFAGLIHATREITKISLGRLIRTQAPIVAASAIMAAGVWGVGQSVGDDLTIRVLAQVAAGVAIYTPAILALTRFEVIAEIRDVLRDLRAPTA